MRPLSIKQLFYTGLALHLVAFAMWGIVLSQTVFPYSLLGWLAWVLAWLGVMAWCNHFYQRGRRGDLV